MLIPPHGHPDHSCGDVAAGVIAHMIASAAGVHDDEHCVLDGSGVSMHGGPTVFFVVTGKDNVDEILRPNDERMRTFLDMQNKRANSRWN